MVRRRQRASARRLRDATRSAVYRDLSSGERKRVRWKPITLRADASWPHWIDSAFGLACFVGYFSTKSWMFILCMWIPMIARKVFRGPSLEVSHDGVRLLRGGSPRLLPWRQVVQFEEVGDRIHFDELRDDGPALRHTVMGLTSAERFKAAAIFRAETAASVFE